MAQTIKLKRSSTQGKVPTTSQLALGEIAINTYDGRIFFEKNDGSATIEHIVTTDSVTTGSITITGTTQTGTLTTTNRIDKQYLDDEVLNTSLNAATSSYLTSVDISSDTNLAGGAGLTLTGDTMAVDYSTNSDNVVAGASSGTPASTSTILFADTGGVNKVALSSLNISLLNNDSGFLTSTGSNADTVDNLHASSFIRSDANDTATGNITFEGTVDVDSQFNAGANIVPQTDNVGEVGTSALTFNNGRFTNFTVDSTLDTNVITADTMSIDGTTQSTNKTSGILQVAGGVGIVKTLNVGEDVVAYASSDERYKDLITPIENPNEKIKLLSGNTFVWNDKHEVFKGKKDIGVIAQEVEKVLPEIVETRDNGYKAVKYEKIVALLIESNKELIKRVEELESKIK